MSGKVKLESSDGKQFTVDRKVIELSQTVRHMLEDLAGADPETAIPIPSVKGATLEKILAWCKYHTENPDPPVPETDKYRTDNIIPWDQEFMKVDMAMLFDIVLAANYMDIKGLLDLGLKTIANLMKGKNAEEIKALFAIPPELQKE